MAATTLCPRIRARSSPDRACGSGPQGSRFDSCRAHHLLNTKRPPSRLLKVATVATDVATRIGLIATAANHLIADLGGIAASRPAGLVASDQNDRMRDGLGVFLVVVGLSWTVLVRDKLGLVIAFAGVTLLAYNVLRADISGSDSGREPPIF
jgi:hypothetical protein